MSLLTGTQLAKSYGPNDLFAGVNVALPRGARIALVGPNGAGKTTLIRMLATLARPTSGTATIAGLRLEPDVHELRRRIGYMPDFFGVYEELTVHEYLEFFCSAYRIRGEKKERVIRDVLELVDLKVKRDDLIGALSRGMQQRLGLARVLVHDPAVLLLDEPASGLDPKARVEIRALLRELVRMGKTILISSHILEDIADLCNRIGLIERGRLVVEGALDEVMRRVQKFRRVVVRATPISETAVARLRAHPSVQELAAQDGVLILTLAADCRDITFVPRTLLEEGAAIAGMDEHAPTLEEAFLNLTKGEVS